MAHWLIKIAFVAVATLSLAGAGSAEPITAHSSTDIVLGGASIGSISEGQIGDGAGTGDYELGIGQVLGAPLRSDDFTWTSGTTYNWTLTFVPGSFGGSVEFTFNGVSNRMGTAIPFNSFFVRAAAELPGTSVEVTKLRIGGPPGSGGTTAIFETANPLEEAKASANGSGGALDILKISNVDLVSGFTLTGKAKLVFAGANPQPQGAELAFQIFVAVSDPSDTDGDGIPNFGFPETCTGGNTFECNDNCPNDANGSQANNDGDALGDACDNCPFATNPPGPDGKQPNEDGDIFGDACDNCPLGCSPVGGGTCKIDDGTNTDGDIWGDRCDNCPGVPNDDQADADGNGKGDVCDDNTIIWDTLAAAEPLGASTPGASKTGDPVAANGAAVTTVELSIDCSSDVASANLGINLTNTTTTFVDFSGCTTAGGPNPTEQLCTNANLAELGATISTTSSVVGPNIVSVGDPPETPVAPGLPADMVLLQLRGRSAADGGLASGLICEALDEGVPLGVLRLQGFVVGTNPLSNSGFGNFDPPLTQLVGPAGAIDDEQVVFQVNPPGDALITLQLRPTESPPGSPPDETRFELLITVDPTNQPQEVARLAFGLTASQTVGPADVSFGGCVQPAPANTRADLQDTLRGCSGSTTDVLAFAVNRDTAFFSGGAADIATYTVGPDDVADIPGDPPNRLPNTLYVAVDSGFVEEGDDPLNPGGGDQRLGDVVFVGPADPPQITFLGTDDLPGFETGPVVSAVAGQITDQNVTLSNSFSPADDTDGDGEPDDLDNCVRVRNADQSNTGGVGFVTSAENFDRIGNACQCADPGRDGVADNGSATGAGEGFNPQDDVVKCQGALAGQALAPNEDSDFCKVTQTAGSFSIIDVLVLEADTAVPGSSGLGDPKEGSLQSCGAAEGN